MSATRELNASDQLLVRYLLGSVSDSEAERLDEASIVDDHLAARLRDVENDLVDAYVSGTLDADARARFEAGYLVSPVRRRKVAFAKRFLTVIDRAAPPSPRATPRATFAWPLLAVAASLLIACGLLFVRDARLRTTLDGALNRSREQERRLADLAQQLENAKAATSEAGRQLERARAAAAVGAQPPPAGRAAVPGVVAAMVLLPQTRSLGPLPTLAVPAAAERVDLDLRLEPTDFKRFEAVLKDARENRALWRSGVVAARTTSAASFVAVTLPAAALQPQRYLIELAGVGNAGRREPVASYAFQVDRR